VHAQHRPEQYAQLRHVVLAFHDSTFECVAKSYDFVLASGPLDRLAAKMLSLVRGGIR
jgi:hypothetical protein